MAVDQKTLRAVRLCLLLVLCLASVSAAPPQRIISLVPNVTEIVYALGAGSRVVAVSSYDTLSLIHI